MTYSPPDLRYYGAKVDAVTYLDATVSTGVNPNVTLPSRTYAAADIGKIIVLPKGGSSTANGVLGTFLTISGGSGHTFNTMGTVSTAVTAGEAIVGTDDTSPIQAAVNSATAGTEFELLGHTIITSPLEFTGSVGIKFTGVSGPFETSTKHYSDNLPAYMQSIPSVIHAAMSSPNYPAIKLTVGQVGGVWGFTSGCSFEGIVVDCAGTTRTGVALRGASCCDFKNTFVARHSPLYGSTYSYSVYDGAWDIGVTNNANFTTVDCAGNSFESWGAINRGSGITGARGLWIWGDTAKGNVAENNSYHGRFLSDEGSLYPYCESQNSDSWNFFGHNSNGYFDLHADDSPLYPRSSTNYVVGAGSSICRSHTFYGYGALIRLYSSTGHAGDKAYAACNHAYYGYPMENIDQWIVHVGPDSTMAVHTQGSVGGAGRGGISYGGSSPGVSTILSGNQSIGNAALTALSWGTTDPTTQNYINGWTSSAATRITIPNGVHQVRIGGSVMFDANTTGQRIIQLFKNGSRVHQGGANPLAGGNVTTVNLPTRLFDVKGGDYFELYAYQNSGGALNVLNADNTTRLEVTYM